MKASIGFADLVALAGTAGRTTGFTTHRSALRPFRGVCPKSTEPQHARQTDQRNQTDTFPHLRRAALSNEFMVLVPGEPGQPAVNPRRRPLPSRWSAEARR